MLSSSVKHRQDTVAFLTAIGLIIITLLSIWLLKKLKLRFIHETGAALLYGMFLGVIVKSLSPGSEGDENWEVHNCVGLNRTHPTLVINISNHLHSFRHVGMVKTPGGPLVSTLPKGTFDPEVLFNLFLPPIIFHGAYTLNQRRFIDNLGSVLTFALLGTVLSCGIIGACVYAFSRLMVLAGQAADDDFLLTDCLLFGALMSATDPVSVLGMLSELHVDPDLYTLLFGESVLNDGVAIVLTHAIATYSLMGGGRLFDTRAFFLSAGHFVAVFAGSFLLGLLFTVITALLTKFARLHENPLLETSLLFLLSWSSFLSAEACGLSGIVAVLFCGLGQARYTLCNLSSEAKTRTKQLLEFSKFLGEIFIFSYMGYILLAFQHHVFKTLFICGAFLSICISRACNIYPLSFLLNLCRTTKIPHNFQHFMMFAGLRGAVAFALALRANDTPTEVRRSILSTTLLVVCVTVLLLGTATMPMLRWLDIRVGVDGDDNPEDQSFDQVTTERPGTQERPPDTATQGLWHCLDHRYLMPALTHSGPPLTFALPSWCGPVARIFRSSHAYEDQKQLQEPEVEVTCVKPEDAEAQQGYVDGNTAGPEHPENLLEGDLGLGSDPALAGEA